MDKIIRSNAIKQRQVKQPVVFAFNILLNHYLAYNTQQYNTVERIIKNDNGVKNLYMLANVTNHSMNIEQRSEQLAKHLKRISWENKGQKVHVIAHSFTGIDARAAISMYGATNVQSLTTICTPHLGMKLIDQLHAQQLEELEIVDKIFEACGVSQKCVHEFHSENIKNFNIVAENNPTTDYYSVASQKKYFHVSDSLRHSHNLLSRKEIQNVSDGIMRPEDCEWGRYLVTFEQDHLEIVGFNPDYNPKQVYNLLVDNIKLNEVKNDPVENKKYGIDHLFQ